MYFALVIESTNVLSSDNLQQNFFYWEYIAERYLIIIQIALSSIYGESGGKKILSHYFLYSTCVSEVSA